MLRVTLDSSVDDPDRLVELSRDYQIQFYVLSVSLREAEGSSFQVSLHRLATLPEVAVWDESRWDEAVFAPDPADPTSPPSLEDILRLLSNGSFPPPGRRAHLSEGERHQLRDAMVLEAHLRNRHDVLITVDAKAFINHGRREHIQSTYGTLVCTPEEFLDRVGNLVEHRGTV